MIQNLKIRLLLVGILFCTLLATSFVNAYIPYLLGKKYEIWVEGFDPRDLALGNYVYLNYNFKEEGKILDCKKIYIPLRPDGEYFSFGSPQCEKPDISPYITSPNNRNYFSGINRYYTSATQAKDLENQLNMQTKGIASVWIYGDFARLETLIIP
ncbi:GDYXXLXY domain-containing protein [Helicobacter monodelphidis]|uniref:GDYXXLXY domain-containing protein n=1 Tax=Helicobacter sp. 15-1451 TaxID=2004995 RepID=UPI0015ECADFB|nr:GDYXXLXY domain-containing protein [Helicobacter sp. 15-1451]